MISINGSKAKIVLNEKLYKFGAVREAVRDFECVCPIEVTGKKPICVVLKPLSKKSADVICYEFCNYVLALMKNKMLV